MDGGYRWFLPPIFPRTLVHSLLPEGECKVCNYLEQVECHFAGKLITTSIEYRIYLAVFVAFHAFFSDNNPWLKCSGVQSMNSIQLHYHYPDCQPRIGGFAFCMNMPFIVNLCGCFHHKWSFIFISLFIIPLISCTNLACCWDPGLGSRVSLVPHAMGTRILNEMQWSSINEFHSTSITINLTATKDRRFIILHEHWKPEWENL
jgi:hypothetical protein